MTSEDAANKGRAEVSLRSQASEEATGMDLAATAEEIAAIFVTNGLPRTAAALLIVGPLERLVDRVSRERTQLALERAAAHIEENAYDLAVYDDCPCGGDCNASCAVVSDTAAEFAKAIRGLSDGESVASEEKR